MAGAIDRWDPDPARGSFRGWLFRIALHLMINFLARQRRQPRPVGDTDFQQLLAQQPAPESDESAYFDQEYRRQLFHWAAEQLRDQLQENTWQAFWRSCVEGQPIKEVAADLQMSLGPVYVARSRTMVKLRKTIQQFDER